MTQSFEQADGVPELAHDSHRNIFSAAFLNPALFTPIAFEHTFAQRAGPWRMQERSINIPVNFLVARRVPSPVLGHRLVAPAAEAGRLLCKWSVHRVLLIGNLGSCRGLQIREVCW